MSSFAHPPLPSLVAIILIVKSPSSPRFIFHYPPNAGSSSSSSTANDTGVATDNASTTSSNSNASSSSEDDDDTTAGGHWGGSAGNIKIGGDNASLTTSHGVSQTRAGRNPEEDEDDSSPTSGEDSGNNGGGAWKAPWDNVLGFGRVGLGGLLTPAGGRRWHKRRFEVGIGEFVFLGWPVFIREDGRWEKRRTKRENKKKEVRERERSGIALGHDEAQDGGEDTDGAEREADMDLEEMEIAVEEAAQGKGNVEAEEPAGTMSMFNVVFVMNPPVLDYTLRVKEMYEHVVKKFGRALKYEQAKCDYVWKETQIILGLKEQARENRHTMANLYSNLLSKSSLARAISSVYTSISASRIASVNLGSVSTSLQIPPITSTSVLSSATDQPTLPGLWLTTADSVHNPDDSVSFGTATTPAQIAKHFALLLLDNEATILKDVEASDGKLGSPLAHYIRCSKPTKSFSQIAAMHNIPLSDIQLLSQHLIYWRRARAVPPLHQRDTYIVSPNADLKKLAVATKTYEAMFPTLPSLPKMLSALSGPPRPWGSLIPSKDHKEAYFSILAWLLRGGWVCQLRSFAWVKVEADVKEAVLDMMRYERDRRRGSGSTDQTGKGSEQASPPKRTRHESTTNGNRLPKEAESTDSIILAPQKASPMESRYLDYIGENLADEELRQVWPAFVKYFNGHDALEKLPVREAIKKRRAWELLGKMGQFTASTTAAQAPGNDQVLVVVRHW